MGGKSSKNNSWNTPQEPIQESPQSMTNSDMYESSIKWQPPDSAQNDAPTYINQHQRDVPNGAHVGSSLYYNQSQLSGKPTNHSPYYNQSQVSVKPTNHSPYYNQSQVSVKPTNHSSENSYANPAQTTAERFQTPTKQVEKTPKGQGKKSPKTQEKKEKKEKKDSSKSSAETPAVTTFPAVHIPRANFDREWYISQLHEKKHLTESVYDAFPESDEGRISNISEREEPTMNRANDRSDSNPAIYSNKEKATRPLIYQSAKQHENVPNEKTSRSNTQSGVDPYSAKNPSKESVTSNQQPTALVQVLPSEPFEIKNLKRHKGHRSSPRNNNNYIPDPDYNENRNSGWEFEYPSAEGRWMPDVDY